MAFIGVVVGAGFASGQEAMQYFVAFGNWGLWGIALAAGLMMITGISILQLGSYFQAEEHTAVYDKVASPFTAKILDWSTLVTLFAIGFVMFAGGGSNINQQFPSIPVWVGATAMLILVLLVGLMDVDRVTAVIGTITPFIIFFVVLATGYTILTADVDFASLNTWAIDNVDTSLPNWWLSALNYTGLNVMTAVSMSIVIGGNFLDNRAVGIGGLIGRQGCLGERARIVGDGQQQTADQVEFVYENGTWKLSKAWACTLIQNTVPPEQVPEMCADTGAGASAPAPAPAEGDGAPAEGDAPAAGAEQAPAEAPVEAPAE